MHFFASWCSLFTIVTGLSVQNSTHYRNVAYFPDWAIYARNYYPQSLPVSDLTHIFYAFAKVSTNGEVSLGDKYAAFDRHFTTDSWNESGNNVYGCIKQIFLHKKRNRNLKVLLSIGGWSYSGTFAAAVSTPQSRSKFVTSAIEILTDAGFDGLDIDWEYPEDKIQAMNFVSLLADLRKGLNERHPDSLLTVACPAGPNHYEKLEIKAMDVYLDFWNLMAYDYAGAWSTAAGHASNWYPSKTNLGSTPFNTDQAIRAYIDAGVHASKIVIGMPLFGRSFMETDGPGKPFFGTGDGTWERGIYDYKDLADRKADFDNETVSSYIYDKDRREMITCDTPFATKMKADLIKRGGYGGAMWWEVSGDRTKNDSLIHLFVNSMGGKGAFESTQNRIEYNDSQYDNLRAGFPNE